MIRRLTTKLLAGIAVGLAAAALAPIASASSPPKVTIPEWMTHIQYPGTSSRPTVYMAGGITIPARLTRLQHPGASSEPTVYLDVQGGGSAVAGTPRSRPVALSDSMDKIHYPGTSSKPTVHMAGGMTIPTWLTRIQYPGTYPEASVVFPRVTSKTAAAPVVTPARGFDWAAFGIGLAAAAGVGLMGASALLALRRRRSPAHA